MADTEATPICGTVTLSSADNMRILLLLIPWMSQRLGMLTVIVFGVLGAAAIAFDDSRSFTEAPFETMGLAFRELWPFAIGSFLFALVLVAMISTIKWARLPRQNKVVTYSADAKGVTTTDAACASVHVPWSMITRSRRMSRYITMKTKSGGLRFLPLRAFSADDCERLWQLVRAHTPVK